mmetsp:Transcript_22252/g.47859  ORF Transcript_22252/g.47859 Transcript_22252/m.47859 type:complete len:252 (-) Transcript_22252:311-1066(-)
MCTLARNASLTNGAILVKLTGAYRRTSGTSRRSTVISTRCPGPPPLILPLLIERYTSSSETCRSSILAPDQVANGISSPPCHTAAVNPGNPFPNMGIRATDTNSDVPGLCRKEFVWIHTQREGKDRPWSFSVYPLPPSKDIVAVDPLSSSLSSPSSPPLLSVVVMVSEPRRAWSNDTTACEHSNPGIHPTGPIAPNCASDTGHGLMFENVSFPLNVKSASSFSRGYKLRSAAKWVKRLPPTCMKCSSFGDA